MTGLLKNLQIFAKFGNFNEILQNNAKISKFLKIQLDNCVDLEKREKMSLLSHSEASIEPRTDPDKMHA